MAEKSDSFVQAANEYFDALVKSRFNEILNDELLTITELKNLITQDQTTEKIDNPEKEIFVTLQSRGKGAKQREITEGKTPVKFTGYRIKAGQFIYSRIDARNGAFDIVPTSLDGAVVSKDFPVFEIDSEKVNPVFLLSSVLQPSFIQQIQSNSFGATNRQRIKEDVLLKYMIKMPSMEIQNQFADFVRQVDKSKLLFQQLVSKYDQLVKSRFIEMFGDWNNDSEYPEMTMSEVCANIVDCPHSTPKYSDSVTIYPTIRTTDIVSGQIVWNQMKYVDEIQYNDRIKRLRPQENDIVLGREGTIGEVALLPPGYAFCLGQRVMLLRANQTVVNPMFLCHVFQSNYVQTIFKSKNTGSTVNHVNVKDVVQLKVYVPPMEAQNQFADFVKQVDKSKSEILEGIKRLNLPQIN